MGKKRLVQYETNTKLCDVDKNLVCKNEKLHQSSTPEHEVGNKDMTERGKTRRIDVCMKEFNITRITQTGA